MNDLTIDRELRLPPLTDSLQRLLGLSAHERNNLRLLELLAHRDTMATTRLMMLANSAAFHRGKGVGTVSDAILRLGAATTYDALLSTWLLSSLPGSDEPTQQEQRLRGRLAQVLTGLCITARRICEALGDPSVALSDVQRDIVLVVAVQLLALSPDAGEAERQALKVAVDEGALLISEPPNPTYLQEYLLALAAYWRARPPHLDQLREWARQRTPSLGIAIGIVAERMAFFLRRKPDCTQDTFLDSLSAYPVAAQLVQRVAAQGVLLRSLSVSL